MWCRGCAAAGVAVLVIGLLESDAMPRQLAEIMAEYAEHEASRFAVPGAQWGPTLFTRDDAGHVRAHEFHEPDDDSAVRRVQGIVLDSRAAVTGLMLTVFDP